MLNLDTLGLAAKITASGITAPDYPTILERLTGYFRQIYGEDAYLEPDSKDGQMIAIYALALHDANNMVIESYNTYSPVRPAALRSLTTSPLTDCHAMQPPARRPILRWWVRSARWLKTVWCVTGTTIRGRCPIPSQ
ncbi:hypothetical protein XBI1_1380009 [Xenorhabdus bovienii str. Intermedium]|uniref:Uncharacterized protein n=1 Tax=Xenorhabdus bovienii str. Intermedium TaxID=1379677 RepID=A0A077QDP7_XENBV|nr:hypothetical protein XBI1_1380009 [Xenorhabdus bovienii str. Intermedium]